MKAFRNNILFICSNCWVIYKMPKPDCSIAGACHKSSDSFFLLDLRAFLCISKTYFEISFNFLNIVNRSIMTYKCFRNLCLFYICIIPNKNHIITIYCNKFVSFWIINNCQTIRVLTWLIFFYCNSFDSWLNICLPKRRRFLVSHYMF